MSKNQGKMLIPEKTDIPWLAWSCSRTFASSDVAARCRSSKLLYSPARLAIETYDAKCKSAKQD